jgi:hypothetical protein
MAQVAPTAPTAAPAKPGPYDSYNVVYTGRLFGYYRYPEVQTLQQQLRDCVDDITDKTAPEANLFRQALDKADPKKTALRVATGDNFAPFLLSRQMWDGTKALVEKETFTEFNGGWRANAAFDKDFSANHPKEYDAFMGGDSPVPIDNVGCFLRLMRFDAIVPGEHDFYFGPSRLQWLARYLADPRVDAPPTRMLGANLYMKTKELPLAVSAITSAPLVPPAPKIPPVLKSLQVKVTAPKTPLPWMRSVKIRNGKDNYQACIVDVTQLQARLGKTKINDLTVPDQAHICDKAEFPMRMLPGDRAVTGDYTAVIAGQQSFKILPYDRDYAVAVLLPKDQKSLLVAWEPFTVVPPFFGFNRLSHVVPDSERPWVVKKEGPESIAVFGLVDPNLMQAVGRYNAAWLERKNQAGLPLDDHYETDIQISDPAEALKQSIEYCLAVGDCDESTRTVLLAQMPQQTASDMLSSFRSADLVDRNIDLIIAEADPDRGTGSRITVRENKNSVGEYNNPKEFGDPVIVVPDPGASDPDPESPDSTFAIIGKANVSPGDSTVNNAPRIVRNESIRPDARAVTTDWFFGPVAALAQGGATLRQHLQFQMWGREHATTDTKLDGVAPLSDADWKLGLRQVALKRMQNYCHSDGAMLQLRDVFFLRLFAEKNLTPDGYEAIMDAIFWKGDYIQCMSVNGGVINSVLQRSKDLQVRQYYGLQSDVSLTLDWSLETLGVNSSQDKSERRLVADKLLDAKKLYSIAVTDFLANGDTGYPAFQGAEPPPDSPWSRTKRISLSDAISNGNQAQERAENVLDSLVRVPGLPESQRFNPPHVFTDWRNAFQKALINDVDVQLGDDPLEEMFQLRPLLTIELYKSDISYSMAAHSGLERAVPQQFPGVSAVDLSQQDSSSFAMDYMVRVQQDWHAHNQVYFSSQLNYGYKKTRIASKSPLPTLANGANCQVNFSVLAGCGDSYSRSQPTNFWYYEGGYAYRFGASRNPYGWKLQLPLALQTQFQPSVTLPEAFSGPMGNTTPISSGKKSYYAAVRPGFRLDFSFPKPSNWTVNPGGGGGQGSGAQQGSGGGGKGGKGGGSSSASSSSSTSTQNSGGSGGSGGGGGAQIQTFDSFFEAGYEGGRSSGPKDFVFTSTSTLVNWMTSIDNPANKNTSTPCNALVQGNSTIVPAASVVSCTNALNVPIANPAKYFAPVFSTIDAGRQRFQDGLYLNYHFDIPLQFPVSRYTVFSNIEFVEDLRSDFFFGRAGDTPIDTHFLIDAKHALNVPILTWVGGRLSLSPSVEMIYYTNKISNNLYRSYIGSVSLSYTFEKRTGLNFRRVLGYSNPVPTLPTLPSR